MISKADVDKAAATKTNFSVAVDVAGQLLKVGQELDLPVVSAICGVLGGACSMDLPVSDRTSSAP